MTNELRQVNLSITSELFSIFKRIAEKKNISIDELIERYLYTLGRILEDGYFLGYSDGINETIERNIGENITILELKNGNIFEVKNVSFISIVNKKIYIASLLDKILFQKDTSIRYYEKHGYGAIYIGTKHRGKNVIVLNIRTNEIRKFKVSKKGNISLTKRFMNGAEKAKIYYSDNFIYMIIY